MNNFYIGLELVVLLCFQSFSLNANARERSLVKIYYSQKEVLKTSIMLEALSISSKQVSAYLEEKGCINVKTDIEGAIIWEGDDDDWATFVGAYGEAQCYAENWEASGNKLKTIRVQLSHKRRWWSWLGSGENFYNADSIEGDILAQYFWYNNIEFSSRYTELEGYVDFNAVKPFASKRILSFVKTELKNGDGPIVDVFSL